MAEKFDLEEFTRKLDHHALLIEEHCNECNDIRDSYDDILEGFGHLTNSIVSLKLENEVLIKSLVREI